MSLSEIISPLLGRWLLAWFYATAAVRAGHDRHELAGKMLAHHVPVPSLVLLIGLVLVFLGVISLVFGYQTRHGAVMLFGLTCAGAFVLHDYWRMDDSTLRLLEQEVFTRDVAICGGLLLLVGMGPGPFSVDGKVASVAAKKKK